MRAAVEVQSPEAAVSQSVAECGGFGVEGCFGGETCEAPNTSPKRCNPKASPSLSFQKTLQ